MIIAVTPPPLELLLLLLAHLRIVFSSGHGLLLVLVVTSRVVEKRIQIVPKLYALQPQRKLSEAKQQSSTQTSYLWTNWVLPICATYLCYSTSHVSIAWDSVLHSLQEHSYSPALTGVKPFNFDFDSYYLIHCRTSTFTVTAQPPYVMNLALVIIHRVDIPKVKTKALAINKGNSRKDQDRKEEGQQVLVNNN